VSELMRLVKEEQHTANARMVRKAIKQVRGAQRAKYERIKRAALAAQNISGAGAGE